MPTNIIVLHYNYCRRVFKNNYFTHSHTHFSLGAFADAAAPGGLEIPDGFQQSHIVLLVPHQDETKQGQIRSHTTCSFVDLWATFPWV